MIYPQDRNRHRPLHLFNQGEIYLVTGRNYKKTAYFSGPKKEIIRNCLIAAIKKYQPTIYAWAILNSHYHLLLSFDGRDELVSVGCDELSPSGSEGEIRCHGKFELVVRNDNEFRSPRHSPGSLNSSDPGDGLSGRNQLARFIQYIHRGSARVINKIDHQPGRKVWYQYWDSSIKREKDFYTCFNYIHLNPIKHGLIKNLKELKNYPFCSYQAWLAKMGKEWLKEIIAGYPIEGCRLEVD